VSWRSIRVATPDEQPARQVAVLDLGSNSWRVVVFTYAPQSWWKRTDELYETVRIGAGIDGSGRLGDDAMRRGLETLGVFARFCRAHGLGPKEVHAVATSAIRDATNRDEFLREAKAASGIDVEVLSEDEEARLAYVAAVNTTTLDDGVVVELGGGSLQLVGVHDRQAVSTASFKLGAVRLTERFLPGPAPAKKKELERVREHVRKTLAEVRWLSGGNARLVGLGGAVRNLAAAAEPAAVRSEVGIQGYMITSQQLRALVRQLAELPVAERGAVPGIKPGRADIILAAAVALETVVELADAAGLEVTEAGLREGLFIARELLGAKEPLLEDVRVAAVHNLAVQYEADLVHSEHVAALALQMYDSLLAADLFKPVTGERELLWAAAMLHDVGMTISYDDHHKHSQYLIVSAELPGFDPRERALIAQISRYHRKGTPKLDEMAPLANEGDAELLERCALLLRVAEHLERGRDQSVREVRLRANGDGVDLHLEAAGDLTLPRWSVERYGDDEAFERVFGRRLLIG